MTTTTETTETGVAWQSETCDCRAMVGDGWAVEYACPEHAADSQDAD